MGQLTSNRMRRAMRWAALLLVCLAWAGAAVAQSGTAPAEEEIEFNPLKAEKNLEVGRYYLRAGNYDAAIDRLKDALKYKSNFAMPHRYLGEAYERKGRFEDAVKHYKRYLEILPSADDAERIEKRVAKLEERIAKAKK